MIRSKNHERLIGAIRDSVPSAAGVYIFKGTNGKAIYIGKSVRLRGRMLSYFRQDFDTADSRIGQLIYGIETFDYVTTDTELQALLLEDYLIKKELPEYNIRQKQFEENRYLLLTGDPYPALLMIENSGPKERGTVFGPFRDRHFVIELLDLIYRYYPMRACSDSVPNGKCLNYDVGRCAGPCRDAVSPDTYQIMTKHVSGFLEGRDSSIALDIQNEMEAAARNRQYERAEKHKNHLQLCARFAARQRFIRKFRSGSLVIEEKDKNIFHRFDKGIWVKGKGKMKGSAGAKCRIRENYDILQQDPRFVVDRANIIYTWINGNKTECEHYFLR